MTEERRENAVRVYILRLYFIFTRKDFLMRKKAACFDKNILNIFATAVATGYNVAMENARGKP